MPRAQPPFVGHALDLLSPLGAVQARAMFGGWGVFIGDQMFALIAEDELYFKADDQSKGRFAAAGSTPFVYAGKGKAVQMSYWRCPEAALDDTDAFLAFARLGLDAALRSRRPKRRRKD